MTRESGVTGTGYYFVPNGVAPSFTVEFDMISCGTRTSNGLDFAVSGSDNNKTFNALGIFDGDHVKIIYDGTTVKVYRNDSTTSIDTSLPLTGNVDIGFVVLVGQSVKYKDFKIYYG